MTIAFWLGLLAALGGAFYFALRSPAVWTALSQALAGAVQRAVLKGLKPRDMTQAEKDQVARGEEHSDRPFGHGKGE